MFTCENSNSVKINYQTTKSTQIENPFGLHKNAVKWHTQALSQIDKSNLIGNNSIYTAFYFQLVALFRIMTILFAAAAIAGMQFLFACLLVYILPLCIQATADYRVGKL